MRRSGKGSFGEFAEDVARQDKICDNINGTSRGWRTSSSSTDSNDSESSCSDTSISGSTDGSTWELSGAVFRRIVHCESQK